MPLFDQEKMVKLVSEIRKNRDRLRVLAKLRREEFLNDPDKIGSAKYHFIVAIEAAIDMCNHFPFFTHIEKSIDRSMITK